MKNRIWITAMLLVSLLVMAACGTDNEKDQKGTENNNASEEKVIVDENTKIEESMTEEELEEIALAVLEANVKYAETEELDKYLNTLSSEANNEETIASIEELFDAFNLDYDLLDVEIQSITHEEATIFVTQKTVATEIVDGYQFKHHIVDATHTLINENGNYKIYTTEVHQESIQYLDANGEPLE